MKTDLNHLPKPKQDDIRYIVNVLLDEVEQVTSFATGKKKHSRVMLIILFGSYARGSWVDDPEGGYFSDYDLLVVLNRRELIDDDRVWHIANERIMQKVKASTNVLVHTRSEVNDWLKKGNYFFCDIYKEGIQLYQFDNAKLSAPGKLSMEEAKSAAREYFDQWYPNAVKRFEGYKFYRQKDYLNHAAFDLHQVAESAFACTLLVFTLYLPKSHNLEHLGNLIVQQEEEFKSVFPLDSRFARRCFQLLKRAYVEARYSKHYKITEEELDWLAERVELLLALTEKMCKLRIENYR